ncbi:MAG: hypothetical protein RLZZ519_2799 [Bacteroidota bacterium]|jgi:hypothetical protein
MSLKADARWFRLQDWRMILEPISSTCQCSTLSTFYEVFDDECPMFKCHAASIEFECLGLQIECLTFDFEC